MGTEILKKIYTNFLSISFHDNDTKAQLTLIVLLRENGRLFVFI